MVSLSRKGLVHGIMPPFLRVALPSVERSVSPDSHAARLNSSACRNSHELKGVN